MNALALLRPVPGLRVLITGAGSGIGAGIAEAFLQAEANVYVCDVDGAALDALKKKNPHCTRALQTSANEKTSTAS